MRTPPGPIPKLLPNISNVVKKLHETIHRPITRLADASIYSLASMFEGDCWLTGSTVWLQAVYEAPPDLNGDFDIIFSNDDNLYGFKEVVIEQLNRRIGKMTYVGGLEAVSPGGFKAITNKMGGTRIAHPDGRGIMDLWALENESIAECVSAFPGGNHVRCAYQISKHPRAANLTRVVSIPKLKRSSYPGNHEVKLQKPSLLDGLLDKWI